MRPKSSRLSLAVIALFSSFSLAPISVWGINVTVVETEFEQEPHDPAPPPPDLNDLGLDDVRPKALSSSNTGSSAGFGTFGGGLQGGSGSSNSLGSPPLGGGLVGGGSGGPSGGTQTFPPPQGDPPPDPDPDPDPDPNPSVPEPASVLIGTLGVLGIGLARKFRAGTRDKA